MKISVSAFKGLAPIITNRLLPPGFASSAVNAKLVSGDLDSFIDIGNPFQLSVEPIINAIWLMMGPPPTYWLQFSQSEVAYGTNVDVSLGTIPGDTTYRTFITGLAGGPKQTNLFYATDPSQQGSNPAGAYPYVTFPLGIISPAAAPTVVAPVQPTGPETTYEYAQEAGVNNAGVANVGTGYVVGDVVSLDGGTPLVSGFPAQVTINNVTTSGAIDTTQAQCITLSAQGFYANNAGPGSTTINHSGGYSLPVTSIALTSVAGMPTSGSISVANTSFANQTISYTGISGSTLTGCSGGTGTISNGAAVQPSTATVGSTGGSGSGATFTINVVPQAGTTDHPPTGWGFSPYDNGAGSFGHFEVNTLNEFQWNVTNGQGSIYVVYSTTSFALQTASSFLLQVDATANSNGIGGWCDLVFQFCGTFNGLAPFGQVVGPTLVLNTDNGSLGLYPTVTQVNESPVSGSPVASENYPFAGQTQYRIKISGIIAKNASVPGFSVTATVALTSAPNSPLVTLTGFVPYAGDQFGIGINNRAGTSNGLFENVLIQVTQPASEVTAESTSYVYTYVTTYGSGDNAITQESGPSDPSATVTIYFDTATNPITLNPVTGSIPACPPGLDISAYNLYRLVQQSDGSEVYQFDQTITAVSTTMAVDFTDTVLDTDLGDALLTTNYAPPPSNMQGILALPNGIMAGFFANTLCLSAQNFPFAWPVANQLPTDTPIVAIAAIDATVLVLTTANPYTAWGNDPSAYTMSKERAEQGCVSKRSAATHKRLGVIYASGNGLCYYAGQGALDLIRMPNGDPYFTVEQWQALNPSSIIGVVHDDKYWFWYATAGGTKGGFVLDLSPAGFGLAALDFHVTAAYVNPADDIMYFCPDSSVYPINGSVVSTAQNIVYQWEGGTGVRARTWERDEYLLPRPAVFSMARVRAEDYSDITLTISNENGTAYSGSVTGPMEFMIFPVEGIRWNVALTGTSRMNTAEMVEQVEEFTTA